MTQCTYTGAKIYFSEYEFVAPADLYVVEDTVIIRWNSNGKQFGPSNQIATHSCIIGKIGWHREDIGVTVVPKYQFFGPIYR